MAENMPAFMTYREAALLYKVLPDADAAAVIKATVDYYLTGDDPGFSGTLAAVFDVMKTGVDKGRSEWQKRSEHGRKAITARWNKDKSTSDTRVLPEYTNQNQNVNQNVNSIQNESQNNAREAGIVENSDLSTGFQHSFQQSGEMTQEERRKRWMEEHKPRGGYEA